MVGMAAHIFPGQGAQYVGMGKDLYENSAAAKGIFDRADKALGFSISALCFNGPEDKLKRTDICQLAIFTTSIAALEAFTAVEEGRGAARQLPGFVAGLSLGEYTALAAAGVLCFEDALSLVQARGRLMDKAAEAHPGKMAAIIGLDKDRVEDICRKTGIEIANLNCPGQVVVSGRARQMEEVKVELEKAGASKVVFLEVSGAFHSSLMKEASVELARHMDKCEFGEPKTRFISNVTAKPAAGAEEIRQNLVKQMYSPVLWEESVRFMAKEGVSRFYEIGPNRVLKGILRKIDPSLEVINIGKYMEAGNAA